MTFETKTIWQYKSSMFRDHKINPIIPVYKTKFTIEQQNLSITKYMVNTWIPYTERGRIELALM